jgi:putative DNA primase/helicase
MLEFEGRAVSRMPEFLGAMNGPVKETFVKLWIGYRVRTPSGGVHLVFRLSDGPALGNTKIARRPRSLAELLEFLPVEIERLKDKHTPFAALFDDLELLEFGNATSEDVLRIGRKFPLVLIETRGEGGFIVSAPSNGTTHPSGGQWVLEAGSYGTVPVITCAERDALYECLESFDEMPQQVRSNVPRSPQADSSNPFEGGYSSSFASPFDAFNEHANWAEILTPHGWTYLYTTGEGKSHWARPGKDPSQGNSLTTGLGEDGKDLAHNHSTSTDLPTGTHSKAFVWAHYNCGGDLQAAAQALYDQGWGDRRRSHATGAPVNEFSGMALPDEFWESRPLLSEIRQLGWATRRMPEGLLGQTIARVLAHTSPSVVLCGQNGGAAGKASLNFIAAMSGASGHGKSQGADIIEDKLEIKYPTLPVTTYTAGYGEQERPRRRKPSSGQGMPFLYQKRASKGQSHGERTAYLAYCHIDEGSGLERSASIKGADPTSSLCEAWSGEDLEAANAGETRSCIERHTYRMAMTLNTQPAKAGWLLSGPAIATGLTQRIVWFNTYRYPGRYVPEERPAEPEKLVVRLPEEAALVFQPEIADLYGGPVWSPDENLTVMQMAPLERSETEALEDFLDSGGVLPEMDGHRNLLRRKVAAALSLMDGRIDRNDDDWILAGMVMDASDAVREYVRSKVIEVLAEENVQQAKSKGHALHVQNKTVIELESKAQEELADAVIEFISSRGEATLRDIKRGPGQRKGARDAIENLLDEMVEDGRIGRESCPLKNGQEAYRFFIPESE